MIVQYIIIALVLAICLLLASRWIYASLTDASSACKGCALKDACNKNAQAKKHKGKTCSEKK